MGAVLNGIAIGILAVIFFCLMSTSLFVLFYGGSSFWDYLLSLLILGAVIWALIKLTYRSKQTKIRDEMIRQKQIYEEELIKERARLQARREKRKR